ncbi:MAG TPA: HD domain-containing phosphohydrolase [Actinomycetota bacterium]|nr:HD domain-containing phosphohydrolase [Actinomycetota bacterium]
MRSRALTGPDPARVLVVDDEEGIRRVVARVLRGAGHECTEAADTETARRLIGRQHFDLVVTDMTMPGDSGMELLNHLCDRHPDIAAIMVTGTDDPALAEAALDLGAYGYVVKPFRNNEIVTTVSNALRRRVLEIESRDRQHTLEQQVRARTKELWHAVRELSAGQKELQLSREETVHILARAGEHRDTETGEHVTRMSRYCEILYRNAFDDPARAETVRLAAVMHDIGKVGIPDHILRKPGKLTDDEMAIMRRHPRIGYEIVAGSSSELLQIAAQIAYTHHEWYDGSGYPRGLKGEDIPVGGRIAAIADVFDALTSARVYRDARSVVDAIEIVKSESGTHFDPKLVDVFLDSIDEVLAVRDPIR